MMTEKIHRGPSAANRYHSDGLKFRHLRQEIIHGATVGVHVPLTQADKNEVVPERINRGKRPRQGRAVHARNGRQSGRHLQASAKDIDFQFIEPG